MAELSSCICGRTYNPDVAAGECPDCGRSRSISKAAGESNADFDKRLGLPDGKGRDSEPARHSSAREIE